ncbi:MAG TPA: c-type cytochrome [Casimicrobiaceae bacterium]|nr:c-type cytochrome [Casimicrobiaceae bacterium]
MFTTLHFGGRRSPVGQCASRLVLAALATVISCVSVGVLAQSAQRSGKQVVDAVCVSCHGSGANGAPKIGDTKAWAPRASKGLTSLTASALTGIRNMPAHGGSKGVSDAEISSAIVYMVNESGGNWNEPIDRTKAVTPRSGQQVVLLHCGKCHESGAGGAPRIGDRDAWIPRAKQGFDGLVSSAINGHGGMPARGGMASLTDAEIRAAITYMLNPGGTGTKAAPAAAAK